MFRLCARFNPRISSSSTPSSLVSRHLSAHSSLDKSMIKTSTISITISHLEGTRNLRIATRAFSSWLSSPPKPPLLNSKDDSGNRIQELREKVSSQEMSKRNVVNDLDIIIEEYRGTVKDKRADLLQARLEESRRDKDKLVGSGERKNPAYNVFSFAIGCVLCYVVWKALRKKDGLFTDNFKEIHPIETPESIAIKDNFQELDFEDEEHITTTFADVKGNEDAKEELTDLVDYLKDPAKYQAMGLDLPKGVLLDGPPGTGKTLMARALAGEAGVPFITANGSSFVQVFVGLGAQRVRRLFSRAREIAPCIVFIDEIDSIGTRRNTPQNYSKQTLNQLLGELDGFSANSGVIVVAATNLAQSLDPALVRPGRFDRKVKIVLPDKKIRKEILELYLKDNAAEDVDLALLAAGTTGSSGSDLKQLVNRAGIETVKQNLTKITMAALIDAQETLTMGRANKDMRMSKETLKSVAYHEAGHALVALYTKGSSPIYKATVLPRGGALGFVAYTPKDEYLGSKENLIAQMDVSMGGRAAEEIIVGEDLVSQGAANDFQQASQLARQLVTKFGMSEVIGKVYYSEEMFSNLSPHTRQIIDDEVRVLINTSFERAKKLLINRSRQHHKLAEALLEEETLSVDRMKIVIGFNEQE